MTAGRCHQPSDYIAALSQSASDAPLPLLASDSAGPTTMWQQYQHLPHTAAILRPSLPRAWASFQTACVPHMPWHPAVPATPYSKAPAYSTPRRESAARTPPKATGGPAWHIAKAGHRSRLLRLWRRSGVAGCRRRSRRRWLPPRKERVRWRWLWRLVSSTERCSRSMVPTEDPPPDLVVAQLSRRRLAGLGSGAGRNAPFPGLQHIAWRPSKQIEVRATSLSIFGAVTNVSMLVYERRVGSICQRIDQHTFVLLDHETSPHCTT